MHTIKLKVQDDIYNHIMFLLGNLKGKKLEIIEDKVISDSGDAIDFSEYRIDAFKNIKDPVEWQKTIRSEWDRG